MVAFHRNEFTKLTNEHSIQFVLTSGILLVLPHAHRQERKKGIGQKKVIESDYRSCCIYV